MCVFLLIIVWLSCGTFVVVVVVVVAERREMNRDRIWCALSAGGRTTTAAPASGSESRLQHTQLENIDSIGDAAVVAAAARIGATFQIVIHCVHMHTHMWLGCVCVCFFCVLLSSVFGWWLVAVHISFDRIE